MKQTPLTHLQELGRSPGPFAFEQVSNNAYSNAVSDTVEGVMQRMHPSNPKALEDNLFGPGHTMEAIIGSGLVGSELIALKEQATRHALGFYAGINTIEDHSRLVEELGRHNLLGVTVQRHNDQPTAHASLPMLSRSSADRVLQETGPWRGRDVLYLPLLGGGLTPTAQTALYNQRSQPDADIAMYPVRFSTRKAYDRKPFLAEGEAEHIQELARKKLVVVHDDDTQSARTLLGAVDHFSKLLPKNRVVGIANNDLRDAGHQKQTKRQILVSKANLRSR